MRRIGLVACNAHQVSVESTVKAGASSAIIVTLGGQWGRYVIQIASIVVLARVLSPEDYGYYTMVMAILGLAVVLGDFGLSLAAIRAPNLTQAQKSNLLWISGALGLAIGLTTFFSGPLIADIYGVPELDAISKVLSVTFLFSGISAQFRAELNRSERYGAMAGIDLGSQAVAFAVSLGVALAGGQYWALVVLQVVQITGALIGLVTAAKWRPGMYRRGVPMRELLRTGISTSAAQILNYVSVNVPSLVLGMRHDASVVGQFNRAQQLGALPIVQIANPLTRVALPSLTRQRGASNFQSLVADWSRAMTFGLSGLVMLIASFAPEVVWLALGPGWSNAARILAILCIGGAIQAAGYGYYWLFLAEGRMGTLLACEVPGRIVMILGVVFVGRDGPISIAIIIALGQALIFATVSLFGLPRAMSNPGRMIGTSIYYLILYGAGYVACVLIRESHERGGISFAPMMASMASIWIVLPAYVFLTSRSLRVQFRGLLKRVK